MAIRSLNRQKRDTDCHGHKCPRNDVVIIMVLSNSFAVQNRLHQLITGIPQGQQKEGAIAP